ncbi:hypothetical protein BB561_005008 [Smittium simulii]|uniref:Replication factor C subunit 5 n=1 Tax=Smittium simulii TaxID=133385 RepID=A0A2T9YCR6_9FUNG|nr:hypothetical protein BB561_005008 [Smittium simulii]
MALWASAENIPHLLFHGCEGVGKKTKIMGLLKEIFGPSVEKLKMDQRTFQTPSSRTLEINIISSNFHIELNPSDAGIYDRIVVQDIIKEMAQTQQVSSSAARKFKDSLTKNAQHALRRTMEKYMRNLRVIMCCTSLANIIQPLQSRCLIVRNSAPTTQDIIPILEHVASKENFQLPNSIAVRIAEQSDRNLRKAILMLEATYVTQFPFSDNVDLPLPDWETIVNDLAKSLLDAQSPAVVLKSRSTLYELLTHCIPPTDILKKLVQFLLDKVDDNIKPDIILEAAKYEERMNKGQKPIFHLEAFVAKFQAMYKRFLMELDVDF